MGFTQYRGFHEQPCFVCDEHAKMVADDPEAYGKLTMLEVPK